VKTNPILLEYDYKLRKTKLNTLREPTPFNKLQAPLKPSQQGLFRRKNTPTLRRHWSPLLFVGINLMRHQSSPLFVGIDLQKTLILTIVCYVGTNLLTSSSFASLSLECLFLLSSPNILCAHYFYFRQICSALTTFDFSRSTQHSLLLLLSNLLDAYSFFFHSSFTRYSCFYFYLRSSFTGFVF